MECIQVRLRKAEILIPYLNGRNHIAGLNRSLNTSSTFRIAVSKVCLCDTLRQQRRSGIHNADCDITVSVCDFKLLQNLIFIEKLHGLLLHESHIQQLAGFMKGTICNDFPPIIRKLCCRAQNNTDKLYVFILCGNRQISLAGIHYAGTSTGNTCIQIVVLGHQVIGAGKLP